MFRAAKLATNGTHFCGSSSGIAIYHFTLLRSRFFGCSETEKKASKMWRSLGILLLVGLTLADKPEPAFKGAKVKSVAPVKPDEKAGAPVNKQTPAQDRQDTYGSPAAPAVDTYGSPQAPVQDSYGSPQAAPEGPAPVQGEVGTQGYYYYYYPVANSYSPSQTYQSGNKSPASSSGGGLFGGGLGLLLLLGVGILIVGGIVLAGLSNNNRRSFNDYMSLTDMDDLAYKVYEAIEYFSS